MAERTVSLTKQFLHCLIPVLVLIVVHYLTYGVAMEIVGTNATAYSLNTIVDDLWPFQPIWIFVYIADYYFNLVFYFLMALGSKKNFYVFASATILIQVIAFFFFVFFPVAPPRPELVSNDLLTNMVRENYATDLSYNCFPSLHCGLTVLTALGFYQIQRIPKWLKVSVNIFAALVCLSTLFLKQHFFVDVVFGVGLAFFLFWACERFGWYKPCMRFFEWINRHIWR